MADGRRPGGRPIREGSFWSILDPAEKAQFEKVGAKRRFKRGESLCHQGDFSSHVYVLHSGTIEIVTDDTTGYRSVLALRSSGDIAGEFAAVDGNPRSATVRALEQVDAVVVPVERFRAMCQSRPKLAWAVLLVVVERLREISRQHAEHGARTVIQRLAALLVELADRYGEQTDDGIAIELPLPQRTIAGLLSISRESVVRAMRELREEHVVITAYQRTVIKRPDVLRRLAA